MSHSLSSVFLLCLARKYVLVKRCPILLLWEVSSLLVPFFSLGLLSFFLHFSLRSQLDSRLDLCFSSRLDLPLPSDLDCFSRLACPSRLNAKKRSQLSTNPDSLGDIRC